MSKVASLFDDVVKSADDIVMDATELAKTNYTEYSRYVGQGRAYPCIYDGLKSSYKRALYGMYLNNTHKIVKVAELAAFALPYHPHPTSVSGVIVALGDGSNKLKLIETQGNWGNSAKNIQASADRYIGGYLTTFAESLLCDAVEYAPQIKGEIDKDEPKALPALLPLCFVNGSKGIPSGLPTLNIPTIDVQGMVDYYIDILSHKDVNYVPKKFPKYSYKCDVISSEEEWKTVLQTGKGPIRFAPKMSIENNVITITELPLTKTFEHVKTILDKEILADKIDARDESAVNTCIVIEKVPHKQCDMNELYKRLYNKLQCSETFNMCFFDEDTIYVPCSFNKVIRTNLQYTMNTQMVRIKEELEQLQDKLTVLEIVEDMKQKNSFKSLFDLDSNSAIEFISNTYKCTKEVSSKVLQKPLSYLTKEHKKEIEELRASIEEHHNDKNDIFEFMLKKYKKLKKLLVENLQS